MTQSQKILSMLEGAGDKGVMNSALINVSFRYGARIHDLRNDGHEITTELKKGGLCKYILQSD